MRFCTITLAMAACSASVLAGDETIHRLVAEAKDGETVRIRAGCYLIDRPITVPQDKCVRLVAEGEGDVVVDAQNKTNCFVFLSKGDNLLKGITIRNGRGAPCLPGDDAWYAGGVVMKGGRIERCKVLDCTTLSPKQARGGGIMTSGLVKDTLVSNCAARVKRAHMGSTHPLTCSGGGILLWDGPGAQGCTIVGCIAEALEPGASVGGFGGGVEIFGRASLRDSVVRNCFASMGGGGVHVNSGGSVRGCEIVSNAVKVAWQWNPVNVGGGVALGSACSGSHVERTRFEGNHIGGVEALEAPCGGGGLGVVHCRDVTVSNCTFVGNQAPNGGAAYFNAASATIMDCRAANNRATRFGSTFVTTVPDGIRCTNCPVAADETLLEVRKLYNRDTDWMRGAIGVFQHRLYGSCPAALEAMKRIDPKALADQLADIGADYFCITINQCEPSFLAPNDVLEDICGYRRGEICSQRDVPEELHEALQAKGIRLMLYTTGAPPRGDTNGVRRVGYISRGVKKDPLYTREGVKNWAKVFEFWSRRYGTRVSGWWIDGCYEADGFVRTGAAELFAKALKAGNPNAVVTFNPGIMLTPYAAYEDYICGETNEPFFETCEGRWLDGRQWHLLTYLHAPMGGGVMGLRYLDCEWVDWLSTVTRNGGCVTIDVSSRDTACLSPAPTEQLKRVIAAVRGRISPGSAEARRLDRQRELLRRLKPIENEHYVIEHGKRHFSKHLCAFADRQPNLSLVRKGPNGEDVYTEAIQATLDAFGGVFLPSREKPYYLDRPITLKGGQSIWGSGKRSTLSPIPGWEGPLVTAVEGTRNIFVNRLSFAGAESPVRFTKVDGLVVLDLRFEGCRGTGVQLESVSDFRVDGVSFWKTGKDALAFGVRADGLTRNGMVRNVDVREGAGPREAVTVSEGILLDNVIGRKDR